MEYCIDHPNNIAVEACTQCGKLICGLHDDVLCKQHSEQAEKIGKPMIILVMVAVTLMFSLLVSLVITFLNQIQSTNSSSSGQVVTVDGQTVTVTDAVNLPDLTTIIAIFFAITVPILSIIAYVLIRLSRSAVEPSVRVMEDNETKLFYCQNCGHKLTWDDHICPKCGKSTEDERRLVS